MIIEKRQEVGKKGKQESREDKSIYIYTYMRYACWTDGRITCIATYQIPAHIHIYVQTINVIRNKKPPIRRSS